MSVCWQLLYFLQFDVKQVSYRQAQAHTKGATNQTLVLLLCLYAIQHGTHVHIAKKHEVNTNRVFAQPQLPDVLRRSSLSKII